MRIQIDTTEKKVYLVEDIKLSELRKFLKKTFPADHKEFTIASNNYFYLPTYGTMTNTAPNWPVTYTTTDTNNIQTFNVGDTTSKTQQGTT